MVEDVPVYGRKGISDNTAITPRAVEVHWRGDHNILDLKVQIPLDFKGTIEKLLVSALNDLACHTNLEVVFCISDELFSSIYLRGSRVNHIDFRGSRYACF